MRPLPQHLIAAAAAALALAAWFGPMSHLAAYRDYQLVDTPTYYAYAQRVADGDLPYRDFAVEYPPLSFAAFLPPRAVAQSEQRYELDFTRMLGGMLALAAAAVVLAVAAAGGGLERQLGAGALVALGPALAGSVALTRFDLWPVLLVALALWAAESRREGWAGAALGLGAAAKLWPALALPALAALALRRHGRRGLGRALGGFALAAGIPFAVALALSPHGLWHALRVQATRPLQVESLGSVVVIAARRVASLGDPTVVTSAGSQNVTGSGASAVAALTAVAAAAAIAWAWYAGQRAVRAAADERAAAGEALRHGFAAVVAAIALGHVLSPQFVLWLLPFPLLVCGRRAWGAWSLTIAALVLTQLEFPHRYWDYALRFDGTALAIVATRDAVLVALLATLLVPVRRSAGTA